MFSSLQQVISERVVGLSFQKLEVSPSVRSNTSDERCARDQHPSTSNNRRATIISTQTTGTIHKPQNHPHIHNPSRCLSSSAAPVLSLLPQRRSQQQRPRSRWSLACSTSKSLCKQQPRILRWLNTRFYTDSPCLRLVDTCTKKCIPPQYREADLNKGESVCLDRCVSKFFEVNVKVSEKMQGEAAAKQGGGMLGA